MTSMKSEIIGVLVLMLLAAVNPAYSWTCSSNCACGRGPGYAYAECPSTKRALTACNAFGSYMKVTCHEPTTNLELLQSFNIGTVPHVIFKNCPLPHKNYAMLLESMGAQNFSQLDIHGSTLSATDLRDRLTGLNSVTSLSLNSLGLTNVPEDFLLSVPQIKELDLRYNKLQLPLGIFEYVPNLRILELGGNSLDYLQPGLFSNLSQLYRLSVWANRLKNLTRETFIGLNQLVALDLHSNGIQEFADDVFAELHGLKVLALEANNFTRLPSSLFRNTRMLEMIRINDNRKELVSLPPALLANLINLREVYLHRMSLSYLPGDLFSGSRNLINIALYGNNLKTLPVELFRDTIHLLKLDLSSNKLENFPHTIFSTLSELKFLDLSKNRLTEVNAYLFANTYSLESLILRRNAISDVHGIAFFNLQKLRKLDLSSNVVSFNSASISYSSPLANCKKLEYLYLSNNSIETIFSDWRNTMAEIKLIDLSHNKLSSIEVEDLIFLSRHVKLDITHNRISTINLRGAETIANPVTSADGNAAISTTVYLDGNPLHCNCAVYDFLRFLEINLAPEARSRLKIVTGNLKCVSPLMYEGTRVSTLLAKHFVCGCDDTNLQKYIGCPQNCNCCVRPNSKALVVNCSNAGLLHAPDELPNVSKLMLLHTQLLLKKNLITRLPNASQPGYENVTLIDVSHNRLNALHIAQLPPKLQRLNLDHNNLTELDMSTFDLLENKINVSLQDNPWICSCKNRDFLSFLNSKLNQVHHLHNVTCITPNGSSVPISRMTVDDICPRDTLLIVMIGITIGVAGLLLGVIATLMCCYRRKVKVWLYAHNLLLWWVAEEELDRDKLHDAFISFSHKDEGFVIKELVPRLETEPKSFKLCLHFQDSIAREITPLQIVHAIKESRRTLVVLSPNFLESIWSRMEIRAAYQQALGEGRAKVIFLLYGDIGPVDSLDPELKTYLSMNTYVKWEDPWSWDKLRYALPHRPSIKEKHYHLNTTAVSDKTDLMFPAMNSPAATTPPADAFNPLFIVDTVATEKGANINGQVTFQRHQIDV